MEKLTIHPVNTLHPRHHAEMLGIVRDNRQVKMSGGYGNHDVKIAYGGKNLFSRCFGNMLVDSTATAEVFNPCVRIKNITFHGIPKQNL